ncbi:MAG: hypothetical protein ACRD3L_08640 [Terriglobales bacterium]
MNTIQVKELGMDAQPAPLPWGRLKLTYTICGCLLALAFTLASAACGGGSTQASGPPPPPNPSACSQGTQAVSMAQVAKFRAPKAMLSDPLLRNRSQAPAAACLSTNDPTSATVGTITGDAAKHFAHLVSTPVDCPTGYACTYQDAEVDFDTQAGPVTGFRFRYLRPKNIADPAHVPVLISVPGTGDCYVGDPSPESIDLEAATNGAAVLEVAPRGHVACYFSGDALYQQSDEIGPNTFGDYDRLVAAFTRGWIDTTVHGDPTRVGMQGASYGGLSGYYYGRQSCVPAITGSPLALVIAEAGSPYIAAGTVQGLDPTDVTAILDGTAAFDTPWGSLKFSPDQQINYPGPLFNDPLRQDVLADVNPAHWFGPDVFGWRSAYDDQADTDTTTFRQNVNHFLGLIGSEDCTIPHAEAMEFFANLVANGMTNARLVSPIYLHGCHQPNTPDGFLPKPTQQNAQLITQWKENLEGGWIARYLLSIAPPSPLLDPGAGSPTNQPLWMYMLGDEGVLPTPPKVYSGPVPTLVPENVSALTLPSDLTGETLSYDPAGQGTQIDLKKPAWNEAARAQVCADFPVGQTDAVVIGQPEVLLYGQETSQQSYSFTAVLEDVFPSTACSGGTCVWPVASDRRYRRAGASASQDIDLDSMIYRFAAGHTMRIVISNLAILVHADNTFPNGYPMYAPSTTPYTVKFSATDPGGTGEPASIKVPVLSGAPTLAPSAWQLQ